MIGLAVKYTLALSLELSGWSTGYATHYAPGLMERVARRRGMEAASCMVAYDRAALGEWITLTGKRTGVTRRCKVVDMSAPKDRARHIKANLVELDYASAKAICGRWWNHGWRNCPVQIEHTDR